MNIHKNITLIMVTYRSEDLILKNINILKKFKLIIVDNSNSKKLDSIVKNYDNIKLIISNKNLGYGKAANLAVSFANTEFIMTINPDLILNEDGIKNLMEIYLKDEHNIGILAPSLYDNKKNRRTNGTISYIKQLKGQKISKSLNNLPSYNTCCEFLVGCCYLIKKDLFTSIGGFDENFFMYYEDNDLCDQVLKKGKYIMEVPNSKFIHLENSSSKKNIFTDTKLSIIHKISSYIYIKKNSNFVFLVYHLMKNLLDYTQRLLKNLIIFNFKKTFKNFNRLISIILYITFLYKIIYRFWKI